MPNRILRDWTDSEPVNSLSWQAECLFIRLIMKADDYGCFNGNAKLLRSLLFPLKDGLRDTDISRWIAECVTAGLIRVYRAENKPFIEIRNYQQRLKNSRRKFPAPPETSENSPEVYADSRNFPKLPETSRNFQELPGTSRNFPELPGTSRNFPAESESETETNKKEIYKEKPNKTATELADKLWNLYPLKTGIVPAKLAAKRAYEAELDKGRSPEEAEELLVKAVSEYAEAVQMWSKADRKFIWTMKTFFDAGHQFDDPETWQRKGEKENVSTKDIPANSDFEGFVNNEDF